MKFVLDNQKRWSERGLSLAIWSTVAAVLFAIADGVFKGPLSFRYGMGGHAQRRDPQHGGDMVLRSSPDLRQVMFIGIVLFVGAKFFETRTIFTFGFDNIDSAKISMKGPDDDNIVWIGHRYGTRLEAETIAATIESRLKESSAA